MFFSMVSKEIKQLGTLIGLVFFLLVLLVSAGSAAKTNDKCDFIKDSDLRYYCKNQCDLIKDNDLKYYCKNQCSFIRDNDLRYLCESGRGYYSK